MTLVAPQTIYPGMTVSSTGITIPFTALGGLVQAEADPATGNAAKVLYELLDKASELYAALAADAKSSRMTFTRGQIGASGGNLSRAYSLNFTLGVPSGVDVAAEP